MARIELEALTANLTAEQKIFVSQFYANFDRRSAANRRIANTDPLFFQGLIAGSEFLTYAATKLYLCFSCVLGYNGAVSNDPLSNIFNNEANAAFTQVIDQAAWYDTAGPSRRFYGNTIEATNYYFGCVVTNYTYIKFIGYRVTLA
jgi:hypothetical protein